MGQLQSAVVIFGALTVEHPLFRTHGAIFTHCSTRSCRVWGCRPRPWKRVGRVFFRHHCSRERRQCYRVSRTAFFVRMLNVIFFCSLPSRNQTYSSRIFGVLHTLKIIFYYFGFFRLCACLPSRQIRCTTRFSSTMISGLP